MILKLIGGCMVFASTVLCSDNLYKKIDLREKELKELKVFFESIRNNIINNMDINESVRESTMYSSFTSKKVFLRFCEEFSSKPCSDYYSLWRDVKENMYPLIDEDVEILDEFFKKSHESNTLTAVGKADAVIDALTNRINDIVNNKAKNRKFYYNTGICIGLLTVVLLI